MKYQYLNTSGLLLKVEATCSMLVKCIFPASMENDWMKFQYATKNTVTFKTYELFISRIFLLVYFGLVIEIVEEGKTSV